MSGTAVQSSGPVLAGGLCVGAVPRRLLEGTNPPFQTAMACAWVGTVLSPRRDVQNRVVSLCGASKEMPNFKETTLYSGSLGSGVDEERSKLRVGM